MDFFQPFIPYNEYIKSKEWRKRRLKYLLKNTVCEHCGTRDNLHVHHLIYDNLGMELDEDLQTLCKNCHKKEHIKLDEETEKRQEERDKRVEKIKKSTGTRECSRCKEERSLSFFRYNYIKNKYSIRCINCDNGKAHLGKVWS